MEDLDTVMSGIQTTGRGVNVQCSTLGAMEALMEFLRTSKIPVSGVSLGLIAWIAWAEVFGDKGKHARSAVGLSALPGNVCIEVEMVVEVAD